MPSTKKCQVVYEDKCFSKSELSWINVWLVYPWVKSNKTLTSVIYSFKWYFVAFVPSKHSQTWNIWTKMLDWGKNTSRDNGTAHFKKCKQLFEYQHLLLLRDIWWWKFYSIFKCCSFFSRPVLIRHLWQLKTVVFLHWCLNTSYCIGAYVST
jgi:hypothetical protein